MSNMEQSIQKMSESAPPYEAVPSHTTTRYTTIPQADPEPDQEAHPDFHSHHHLHHQHRHQSYVAPHSDPAFQLHTPDPAQQSHVHCEACDRILQRQLKGRQERLCCLCVAATFMVAFVCLLILGLAFIHSRKH